MRKRNASNKEKKPDLHQAIRHLGIIVEDTNHKVDIIAEQYGGIKEDVGGIKKDVMGLKQDVSGIKIDIGGIKGEIGGIKGEIGGIKKTLDSHTEMIANLAVNLEIVKGDVEFMKHSLKRKVDMEEFAALERRVALLEKRTTQR